MGILTGDSCMVCVITVLSIYLDYIVFFSRHWFNAIECLCSSSCILIFNVKELVLFRTLWFNLLDEFSTIMFQSLVLLRVQNLQIKVPSMFINQ